MGYGSYSIIDLDSLFLEFSKNDVLRGAFISEFEKFMDREILDCVEIKRGIINEASIRELVSNADRARLARSKKIKIQYKGVTNFRGWIRFDSKSQYDKNKTYTQYIKLLDMKDVKSIKDLKKKDIVRLLLYGNIAVSCNCPDFCLHADTEIKLLSGESMPVKDILDKFKSGEELWVYSTDEKGDFKPGKVSDVWVSGTTKRYTKITLDSGEVVKTTGNHPYMLRDGSYKRADMLSVGESLMPLYFRDFGGYEGVRINSKGTYTTVYKVVADEEYSEEDFKVARERSGESSIAIHHLDYNKSNNCPSNLKLMGTKEHIKFHSELLSDRWKSDNGFRSKMTEIAREGAIRRNENPTDRMRESRKKFIAKGLEYWSTEEGRKVKSEEMRESIKNFWKNMTEEEREAHIKKCEPNRVTASENSSKAMLEYWSNVVNKEKHSKRLSDRWEEFFNDLSREELEAFSRGEMEKLCAGWEIWWNNLDPEIKKKRIDKWYSAGREGHKKWRDGMSESDWAEHRNKMFMGQYRRVIDKILGDGEIVCEETYLRYKGPKDPHIKTKFNSFEEFMNYFGLRNNHKVIKVETIELDEEEPVYDIQVDKWHNFCIGAGVVLHNCYHGFKYMGDVLGYGIYREKRAPKIRNPRYEGSVCKHLLAVFHLFMANWLVIYRDLVRSKYWEKYYGEDVEDGKKKRKR